MARRAVQGYSEKTYFENSRFLGMLATNDPLQEGYFKHLVNLDISDTGQSVKPRKGYLTTGVLKNNLIVNFSENTVVYKDNRTQNHLLYDFESNRGFLVDLSSYNLENKLIQSTSEIGTRNWRNVLDHLMTVYTAVQDVYDEGEDVDSSYALAQAYVRQHITYVPETLVANAIDLNGVAKTICKITIEDTDDPDIIGDPVMEKKYFLLTMYYRPNAIPSEGLLADTLEFEIIDMEEHSSYVSSSRNIASSKSLIPDPIQRVYTVANRPSGHVNSVGFLYATSDEEKYIILNSNKLKDYKVVPHFSFNPAEYDLGNDDTAKWAYRVDVVSMDYESDVTAIASEDTIMKGTWYDLADAMAGNTPDPVFPLDESIDLDNEDRLLRHYKSCRYIISVIPEELDSNITRDIAGGGDQDEYYVGTDPTDASEYDTYVDRHVAWKAALDNVVDKRTLLIAIKSMRDSARFVVKDLHSVEYTFTAPSNNTESTDPIRDAAYVNNNVSKDYDALSIDVDEFIELIESGTFESMDMLFRLLPIAFLVDFTWGDGADYDYYWFPSLEYMAGTANIGEYFEGVEMTEIQSQFSGYTMLQLKYDTLNNVSEGVTFCGTLPDESEGVLIDTEAVNTALNGVLEANSFYEIGMSFIVYFRSYLPADITGKDINEIKLIKSAWTSTPHKIAQQFTHAEEQYITYIPEYQEDDPLNIQESHNMRIFNDNILVTWHSNILYLSEPGEFNDYKELNKFTYGEHIVKVLEYKTILLVFTVQHLYAVYLATEESTAYEGDTPVTVVTQYWASQTVLYNILTSEKYKDVIQVFNEYILFYSAEGQLYLIKPNLMIDSETRFSLKYFNQAANDVLLNYDEYINERLANYNIDHRITKDDVQVKALMSINFIKIFFYVPGYITYVLQFDVIQNRFNVYDTITFSDIVDKRFVESGELYITRQDGSIYFTFPYKEANAMDTNVDMNVVNNFGKVAISALLDTGNMSLNNHLRKRFRDLHTVFKNLSTSKLLSNIETEIDDIVSHPFYDTQLEVHDIGGISYYVTVPKMDNNDLIDLIGANQITDAGAAAFVYAMQNGAYDEDSILMDFAEFTSSKLLTNKASIMGMGKVLRVKMQFISKGDYKIQSFGIVYKERRI